MKKFHTIILKYNILCVNKIPTFPSHRFAPAFIQLNTKLSIFEIRIKVVDLLANYYCGGKIGLFGGTKIGKIILSRFSLS